ncbi:MAG TPA: hypothetical protein VGO97_03440 [Solirubrobacterales bacterium]|nr:hypothetical protein [Solirubrobacterales bacterium]
MGRPVPSFGTAGVSEAAKVALPQHVKWRFYEDLVLGPLGQLYLVGIDLFEDGYVPPDYAGYPVDPGDTFVAPVVMKLLHDGRIDPTFGNAGSVNPLAVSESAYVRVLGIDRRGLVLQIDRERRTSRKKHRVTSSVVRVSPSGQRNLNFGVRGEIVIGSWLEDLTTTEHSARAYLGRDRIVTESEAWNCPPEFRAKIYDGRGRFLRRVPKDAVQFPGRCRDIQETWTDGKSILSNASTIQGRDNHTVSNELWKARFPR